MTTFDTPDWLKPREYPDKQFYDVVWQRSDPFNLYHDAGEVFEDFIKVTPSDLHTEQVPLVCHIGTAVSARVMADSEEEALNVFHQKLRWYSENWMR